MPSRVAILRGPKAGERVVAPGQFCIDSPVLPVTSFLLNGTVDVGTTASFDAAATMIEGALRAPSAGPGETRRSAPEPNAVSLPCSLPDRLAPYESQKV